LDIVERTADFYKYANKGPKVEYEELLYDLARDNSVFCLSETIRLFDRMLCLFEKNIRPDVLRLIIKRIPVSLINIWSYVDTSTRVAADTRGLYYLLRLLTRLLEGHWKKDWMLVWQTAWKNAWGARWETGGEAAWEAAWEAVEKIIKEAAREMTGRFCMELAGAEWVEFFRFPAQDWPDQDPWAGAELIAKGRKEWPTLWQDALANTGQDTWEHGC
jgi:hypothetical protein